MCDKLSKKPIIIFAGPSGVGKGTIEQFLFNDKDLKLKLSCSATTRKPRIGEINGVHYFFISKDEFIQKIQNNEFLEYSFHFDNYYGTLYEEIDRIHSLNMIPFLEIETNGAKQILEKEASLDNYRLITLFILPPTLDDLKQRILNRNSEDDASIQKRLDKAIEEMNEKYLFKHHIINDDADRAAKEIKDIILQEIEE
ncbi:guanylate kinase [Mycoplasmopsis felifaucium]|uniref:guanylate kinase n=1 Tax=Mycoplasmopsis felifaucium TaxID=35768 RepID=UPI00048795AC|nr:guanylate kinase [Mycoplasmopsis felifaucium]